MQLVKEFLFGKQQIATEKKFEHFESFPLEVQGRILSYLSIKDLLNFLICSKNSFALANSSYLWRAIGRNLNLAEIDNDDPKGSVFMALKLAREVEKLDYFQKLKFKNLEEHYAYVQNQINLPEVQKKMNVEVNTIAKKFLTFGEISSTTLSRVSFFKQIGAKISYNNATDINFCKRIIKNPDFSKIIEVLSPFPDEPNGRLFLHAFRILDLKSCLILAKNHSRELRINLINPLTIKHLKLAKKLSKKGVSIRAVHNYQITQEIFGSSKFAEKWFALNTSFENLNFPYRYLNSPEEFKIAQVFVKAGYKVPIRFLKAAIISHSFENLAPLIALYKDQPVLNIYVPNFEFNDDEGLNFIKALTPILSNPEKKFCANFAISKIEKPLSPVRREIAKAFLSAGQEISTKTFKKAVASENCAVIKDLISLYTHGFFINFQFPLKYFHKHVHFEIASLFVEAGYKLPLAYLGAAIYHRDLEKIKRLAPFYQNQAPMDIPVPSDFPESKLTQLNELLEPLRKSLH